MPESKHFYQNNKHSQTPLQSPCKNGCTPLIVNHMSFPHSLQHSFFVNCFGDYSLTRLSARILGFVFSRTMFFSCCCSPRPALLTILAPWGHPGGPWEQQQGHPGSGIRFSILGIFRDPIFRAIRALRHKNRVFSHVCFQIIFSDDLGS